MKRILFALGIILLAIPFIVMSASAANGKPAPDTTITLLNPPVGDVLVLPVGESYTFNIEITSSETFVSAVAKVDMYYPGKGVFWHASTDLASQGKTAILHLTVIGKSSTADLAAVCNWPAEGVCWPAGVAPQMVVAGARFKGGLSTGNAFPFAVIVP